MNQGETGIGESGSGKSTVAKIIMGLIRNEGAVSVNGETVKYMQEVCIKSWGSIAGDATDSFDPRRTIRNA